MGENKRSPKLACESWFRAFLLVETLKKLSDYIDYGRKILFIREYEAYRRYAFR